MGHDIEIKIETELFYSTFKGDLVKLLLKKQQTGLPVKSNLLMAGRLVRTVHLYDLTAKNLKQVDPTTKYYTKTDISCQKTHLIRKKN